MDIHDFAEQSPRNKEEEKHTRFISAFLTAYEDAGFFDEAIAFHKKDLDRGDIVAGVDCAQIIKTFAHDIVADMPADDKIRRLMAAIHHERSIAYHHGYNNGQDETIEAIQAEKSFMMSSIKAQYIEMTGRPMKEAESNLVEMLVEALNLGIRERVAHILTVILALRR